MIKKITEQSSNFDHLDKMTTKELLRGINQEDKNVATAVGKSIPQIELFVDKLVERMREGDPPLSLFCKLLPHKELYH